MSMTPRLFASPARRRLTVAIAARTAVAAATSLVLVSTTSAAVARPTGPGRARAGLTGPDVTLPTANLKPHPLAVPGSTPQRRAALQRLGPNARERLAAALAHAPARTATPVIRPAPTGPWHSWRDTVAGTADRAAPRADAAPRFTPRAAVAARDATMMNADADADGLDDGFETGVADAFTPVYHVSAGEHPLTGFARFADAPDQATVSVRSNPPVPPTSHFRVQPLGFGTDVNGQPVGVLRLDYLTLWNRDDGLDITGACRADLILLGGWIGFNASLILEGLKAHDFDNERSAALVAAPVPAPGQFNPDPAAYAAYSYYTAGHEGTFTDTSAYVFPSQPVPAGLHINLAHSRAKHATYTFNPDFYPLLPGWFMATVYSTIEFLWISGIIQDWLLYLALLALADGVFFLCFVEHFTGMGGYFADPRINVGEPGRPINGSSFIADPDLAPKLTVPLW